jgi:hypothetical protein
MADKPEILVHVGAPSTAGDDARYRALVESSLVFEPASHYSVFRIQESDNGAGLEVSVDDSRLVSLSSASVSSSFARQSSIPRHEQTSFHSGDELCSLVTPNALEKSRLTQDIGPPRQPKEITVPSNAPYFHVESTEEDSCLSFQPLIPLSHPNRTQGQPDSPHKPAPANEESTFTSTSSDEVESRNSPTFDIQQTRNEQSTWDTPLDVIPDSQEHQTAADQTNLDDSVQIDRSFVPDSARQSRHFETNKGWTEASRLFDITRIPSSMPSPSPERASQRHGDLEPETGSQGSPPSDVQRSPLPQESTSVLGKRKSVEIDNTTTSKTTQQTTNTASSSSLSSQKKRQTLPQAPETISLTTLPIEIRSPNPPVSNAKFRTHITPTLKSLAERMKHPSRFTPTRQTRDLQPLERGYWFLPGITIIPDTPTTTATSPATQPQTWPQTFFSQFWCFLRDFLTEGRAGWGIWCLLEESKTTATNNQTTNTETETKVVDLKLYTWGEVAPHIYLLLFLATERRIKKMRNVEWRDARDEAVMVM